MDLLPYNTFRVSCQVENFIELNDISQCHFAMAESIVIGHGANILFVSPKIDRPVIKNNLKGKKVLSETDDKVIIEAASGEDWVEFVNWTVENGWSGIENLAYIPGTVGAAPVQNLAAYGQNVGENIQSVTGFSFESKKIETLSYQDCKLYYRDSIFKHELKNKFLITSVTFHLSKKFNFSTSYWGVRPNESLQAEVDKLSLPPYTPKIVAQAVTNLRKIKLPDWHEVGTAGSVFKNPFVSKEKLAQLQKMMPNLQVYPVDAMLYPNPEDPVFKMADMVKIPAGKLLDECGWIGKTIGNVSTYQKHALIVINLGGATGQEIYDYLKMMQNDVKKTYDIDLETEVNII